AEGAVIASLIVDPARIWEVVATGIQPRAFYREKNAWCFEAILDMANAGDVAGINQITVARELARRGRLEDVGGAAYLSQLVGELPTPVGVEHYAVIVHEARQHADLISVGQRIQQEATEAKDKPADVAARAVERLMQARGENRNGHRSLKEMFAALLDWQRA